MRFSKQFAAHAFRIPEGHQHRRITDIADKGLVTALNENGFPYMTALGSLMISNIESVFSVNAAQAEIDMVRLPTAMKTETLERGQKLGDQFRSKIMHLTGSLESHHVISSPETLFIELGLTDQISHSQLPIRHSYLANLHRQKTNGRGALFPQQIHIFGGITVSKTDMVEAEIALIDRVAKRSFQDMGLPVHRENDYNGFDHEYFYICDPANEGENLVLPGVNEEGRVKAYSLGMVYNYPMEGDLRLRFRNTENKNEKPSLVSYGISPTRTLHCILHTSHDDKGFNLPKSVRPFDVVIIPAQESSIPTAKDVYDRLREAMLKAPGGNVNAMKRVALDDRVKVPTIKRNAFAEFIGAPMSVIIRDDSCDITRRDGQQVQLQSTSELSLELISDI